MDKKNVIPVPISRGDIFYISWNYDEKVINDLVFKAMMLYSEIRNIPILPDKLSNLEKEIKRRSIHGTAAIEGNPLTEEEVGDILMNDAFEAKDRKNIEIINLQAAYAVLERKNLENEMVLLSEQMIKTFHNQITKNIDEPENVPGEYRYEPRKVGDKNHGGTYHPPKQLKDIKRLMKEFIETINNTEILKLHPFIRAALAHYYLGLIHPFGDGNGRMSRFIEALMLKKNGIKYIPALLSNYYYRNVDEYYLAFSEARKNKNKDVTPFLIFILNGIIETTHYIKGRIYSLIRYLTVKEHVRNMRVHNAFTRRQSDLLDILMEIPATSFIMSDLLTKPPFLFLYRDVSKRTVLRDIKRLFDLNLLKKNNDGTYELNMLVFG